MSILKSNKVLAAAEAKVEAGLLPQTRASYDKIVIAGMRAGLSGGVESILAGLGQSRDPVYDCARGAVNLVVMLHRQRKRPQRYGARSTQISQRRSTFLRCAKLRPSLRTRSRKPRNHPRARKVPSSPRS